MDSHMALAFALPIGLAITGFASAFGIGKAVAAAMDATARQPEASTKILVNMMAGCALIEALTLYALVFGFALMGKI
ncbi:MAG: F0F1 ATP synthase subunit C [Omnitrophica bacterium RIFCSPLOWO2_12_FULL_44_17]|uniref:ATP synthase F(0) sector subunit c n=1 Tax=Candidatus Danuiimicrobium aquiferis TaxID=1801832 RepID=A0A1G1KWX6_9BACT|nr:MAG: F0F1 ATP synthase subunit C [Omnitrophica bacterium RIFCSPHIGHO2_02_FULL_45_28]OGW89628.1 MAG: F0F1 ATP synthase subunit C [Omnitrophica bacterium RIFCSPHIGHO2_12_FULL_44_12]OGW97434.1 MAG: F0F1 ATP synthase subunit C [Omnitrophica bacterium RIFCSPLOWO2_12_FULL_44_17]